MTGWVSKLTDRDQYTETIFCISKSCIYVHYNEQFEKGIKKIILFIIASKRIKYVRIKFTKEVKDLYIKSVK